MCNEMNENLSLYIEFQIDSIISWIRENEFKNVMLQFSKDLLSCSGYVETLLKQKTNCKFYTVTQTKFSQCCVDVVTAEKLNLDSIVKFGYSCLSPLDTLIPVKYVINQKNFDQSIIEDISEKTINKLKSFGNECITILYDPRLQDVFLSVMKLMEIENINYCIHYSYPILEKTKYFDENILIKNSRIIINEHKCKDVFKNIIYFCIEFDNLTKSNLMPYYCCENIMSVYDISKQRLVDGGSALVNIIAKRDSHIDLVKDCTEVKILSINDAHKSRSDMFYYLRNIAKLAGKNVYLYQNRRLANMNMEVDNALVVVICCPDSIMDYFNLQYKRDEGLSFDMVTPFEFVFGLVKQIESEKFKDASNLFEVSYETDITVLLKPEMRLSIADFKENGGDELVPIDFDNSCKALVLKQDTNKVVTTLNRDTRSYYGLDMRLGQTPVATIQEGLSGIAGSYSSEPKH